jgi:hypothetical protein
MADVTYIVEDGNVEEILGFEKYKESDKKLINSFTLNNLFDPEKHFVELHIYGTANNLLDSDDNYTRYKFYGDAQYAGKPGASFLTIDPVLDIVTYGYERRRVKLLYHFLNDLFTPDKSRAEFFINAISPDRTELRLIATTLDNATVSERAIFVAESIYYQSYFEGFRLNFGNDDLLICTNIQTRDFNNSNIPINPPAPFPPIPLEETTNEKAVVVKLYEPLPSTYDIGSTLNIVEIISDSITYDIDFILPVEPVTQLALKSPNFDIDIQDTSLAPSEYLNYNELFSFPVNNSNSEIYSVFNEKGIEISIDYNNYKDYIHFSSAQERLINFKYKLDLITNYSTNLVQYQTSPGASGSINYYTELIKGVLNNLDHYERYLYYESGSNSWPKNNNSRPYSNIISTSPSAQTWYSNKVNEAVYYDSINNNLLINTIPTYLRDDPNNEHYITFIHMIGQHFDNLWLYGKAVTDKYDADNRLDFGISRDLVAEALRNFGVQLYSSNKSIQDLFTTIIGQSYQSGSEQITNYITGSYTGSNASIQPSSYDNYQKEVYKRIYHNLPLLTSAKGTERGLRALINCFGIPSDILQIKVYGGRSTSETQYYGDYLYHTSSLDKIRIDNTGSIITGSVLSMNTSTVKREYKYTNDQHIVEVGFSPTDSVNNYIISKSLSSTPPVSFDIDDYIGDPRNITSDTYYNYTPSGTPQYNLSQITNQLMSGSQASGSYNVQDFVRIIKFFDNTIFKMIKDFIPARAVADTGIIIKPHILGRSKAKSISLTGSRVMHTGSIDTAFIVGTSGANTFYSTNYTETTQTPNGILNNFRHIHEEAKYNGELKDSEISPSDGELNRDNIYKSQNIGIFNFETGFVSSSLEVCVLSATIQQPFTYYITSSTATYYGAGDIFQGTNTSTQYAIDLNNTNTYSPLSPTFPRVFNNLQPYILSQISASNVGATTPGGCQATSFIMFATCSISLTPAAQAITHFTVTTGASPTYYNIPTFFAGVTGDAPNAQYYITNLTTSNTIGPFGRSQVTAYQFTTANGFNGGDVVQIEIQDFVIGSICKKTIQAPITTCNLGTIPSSSPRGYEFTYGFMQSYVISPSGGGFLGFEPIYGYAWNGFWLEAVPGKGIASYFNPTSLTPTTRFSIFTVKPRPSNPGTFQCDTILPLLSPSTWNQSGMFNNGTDYSTAPLSNFGVITGVPTVYNAVPSTPPSIGIKTPSSNIVVTNFVSGVGLGSSAFMYTLTPATIAVIIKAFDTGTSNYDKLNPPLCRQQVVIYGDAYKYRTTLPPGNPTFVDKTLYADYNEATNGIPLPGSAIEVIVAPMRTWSNGEVF